MSADTSIVWILVLTINIIPYVHNFGHNYVVKKDFFTGGISREFSVYDITEKHLKYRIESRFSFRHNNEIVVYPSKQVVGKLTGRWSMWKYAAYISLLDLSSNQWISGNITETSTLRMTEFTIHWNGTYIILKSDLDILPSTFYEKGRGNLLAQFKQRPASRLWVAKYDIGIFSIKFPEALYLLALAVQELKSIPRRGKK
ncbi:unnamed protein product [Rotaria sp. Silwood2]|nr:unnamed protein product [Rotaria sp. Silwood2]CAF3983157.1 unnamed protein product [Rotaria sp. Silwood2]